MLLNVIMAELSAYLTSDSYNTTEFLKQILSHIYIYMSRCIFYKCHYTAANALIAHLGLPIMGSSSHVYNHLSYFLWVDHSAKQGSLPCVRAMYRGAKICGCKMPAPLPQPYHIMATACEC